MQQRDDPLQTRYAFLITIQIPELKLIEGRLPKRVIALVLEWAFEHRDELTRDWQLAMAKKPLQKVPPLE